MTATDTAPLGLALEGGGAKGAYHMGVAKAYLEDGHTFHAVCGTSIGALNGAVIAQGNFDDGYRMWEQMDAVSIFDIDEAEYRLLLQHKLDKSTIRKLAAKTKKFIANGGMDTSKIRSLIGAVVDETRLRSSVADFGLVTVSITDRMPLELYKDDIPQGQLLDYLLASASFPGFQPAMIDNKYFIDGGLYDNCPINMLARKGYKRVIAVRTLGLGMTRQLQYPDIEVTQIIPSENLGGMMNFDNRLIKRNLQMGYYDAKRQIEGLHGEKYYFHKDSLNDDICRAMLDMIPGEVMTALGRMLGAAASAPSELWDDQIMPQLSRLMRLPKGASLQAFFVRLAEVLAEAKGIEKYTVYDFPAFIHMIKVGPLKNLTGISGRQVEICVAAQRIFDTVRLES